jgi:hypothetical protein
LAFKKWLKFVQNLTITHPPKFSLGCTQNADGSLKDASEIQWQHSRSSSPVDLMDLDQPLLPPLELLSLEPSVPKTQFPKVTNQNIHPSKSWTGAVKKPLRCVALMLADRLEIIKFAENKSRGLSQSKIALYFRSKFPNI